VEAAPGRLFCVRMSALKRNHFELFGLPASFAVDPAALDGAFRRVQGAIHPDRHAGAGEAERRVAMQLATQANEAYRTLREPARRAAYLCALHGEDPKTHSNTSMTPAFLMQQMVWREQLEEARDARSASALEALRAELDGAHASLLARIGAAIDERHDYAQGADLVCQLMFLDKLGTEIDAAEDHLLQA